MNKPTMDKVLQDIGLDIRMELARIVDPRHDRDPQIVLLEVRQICEVLVRTIARVAEISVDKNAAATVLSPAVVEDFDQGGPPNIRSVQETSEDATNHDTQVDRSAAQSAKRKRTRSQIPM